MYQRYLSDRASVDPAWHEFFADYKPAMPAASRLTPGKPDSRRARILGVPRLANDGVGGTDLIGVQDDAFALASVIGSRKLQPPLAVGIFGPWGSGKSFFMDQLERAVRTLSGDESELFCRGVESIWFNAWHYSDTNIWASLLQHIFASLHDRRGPLERLVDEAMTKVATARQDQDAVAAKMDAAQTAEREAQRHLAGEQERYDRSIRQASTVTARDILVQVRLDDDLRHQVDEAARDFGLPRLADSGRDLIEGVASLRALAQRTTALATAHDGKRWWTAALYRGLLVTLVISGVSVAVAWLVAEHHRGSLAPLVGAIGQISALLAGASAFIARHASLARRVLAPAEAAQRQVDERVEQARANADVAVKEAEAHVRRAEAALATAERDLRQARTRTESCRAELADLRGPRVLERYLAARAESDDYTRHLGVVSQAHRDLKDLVSYLAQAQAGQGGETSAERIILFIDDLDRCPPDTVVQVLEAVHLLLALPLFVVVVGVDADWLRRSLEEKHALLLGEPHPGKGTTAEDYLEKIFQLTFTLPPMTGDKCADLLGRLAEETTSSAERLSPVDDARPGTTTPGGALGPVRQAELQRRASEAFRLGPNELAALREVAPLVVTSPRRAKRFMNVYRVVHARHQPDLVADGSEVDRIALMLVVALTIGLPDWAPRALDTAYLVDGSLTVRAWVDNERFPVELRALGERLSALPMSAVQRWVPAARPFAWPITPPRQRR